MKEEIKKEVDDCKRLLHEIQEILHQKIFWKIQGLNLFLIVKKIVYFIAIALSLIFVVSILSQILQLSSYQRVNILRISLFLVFLVEFVRALKNTFHGSEGNLEFVKAMMSGLLWTFIIYLSFSIQLTNYEKISDLLMDWFIIACMFEFTKLIIFRKLSIDIKNGKKTDWIRSLENQVTSKYEEGSLTFKEVLKTYKLKYTSTKFKFKETYDYLSCHGTGVREQGEKNEQK